jgi:hypothetical protein
MSSASPGEQEHRQDCLCHKCESQCARLQTEAAAPLNRLGAHTARYKGDARFEAMPQ